MAVHRFAENGPDAEVKVRKRGTPMSSPLADVFGEVLMFVIDYAVTQRTQGSRLYRLHDDIWFWGTEQHCVRAWAAMEESAKLMGLKFNASKSGTFRISHKDKSPLNPGLPVGDVRWGWLILNSADGQFVIDQAMVEKHTVALSSQLASSKSVFAWIKIWNTYAVRFFTSMMGRPANCLGLPHINSILTTFANVHKQLFPAANGCVTTHVRTMLSERFGVKDVPDGFIYYPFEFGGLGLMNPFVPMFLLRKSALENSDTLMGPNAFFKDEREAFARDKALFEKGQIPKPRNNKFMPTKSGFMSFDEYTQFREETSLQLVAVYQKLLSRPKSQDVHLSEETEELLKDRGDEDARDLPVTKRFSPYQLWIIDLYKEEMIEKYGGLSVVEHRLLPMGESSAATTIQARRC